MKLFYNMQAFYIEPIKELRKRDTIQVTSEAHRPQALQKKEKKRKTLMFSMGWINGKYFMVQTIGGIEPLCILILHPSWSINISVFKIQLIFLGSMTLWSANRNISKWDWRFPSEIESSLQSSLQKSSICGRKSIVYESLYYIQTFHPRSRKEKSHAHFKQFLF